MNDQQQHFHWDNVYQAPTNKRSCFTKRRKSYLAISMYFYNKLGDILVIFLLFGFSYLGGVIEIAEESLLSQIQSSTMMRFFSGSDTTTIFDSTYLR
ncbi:unnamed protein product [Brassica napus]|uniref:(rape) hypothetical protein n=1 Tax=Brassica napus TaxID=3708 RepID=A0A816KQW3_BRANA|nr:unnamed protein product [Brassica napus]